MPDPNPEYWHNACHTFSSSGYSDMPGSYIVHDKRTPEVRLGIGCQNELRLTGSGLIQRTGTGMMADTPSHYIAHSAPPCSVEVHRLFEALANIEEHLLSGAPWSYLVSSDIGRSYSDSSLPLALFVQPALEIVYSPHFLRGRVSYARDGAARDFADALLLLAGRDAGGHRPAPPTSEPSPFSELVTEWTLGESDDSFRQRLRRAISALSDLPEGKLALTRSYRRNVPEACDPFRLYELHAVSNGAYAFSHFICVDEGVFSLGCSPESVFELNGRTISSDVVAATCSSNGDDHAVRRALLTDPKQVREHGISLDNRLTRYERFCRPGSLDVTSKMQIKRLRNVCHLYSTIHGEALSDITSFDILGDVLPLLSARPAELRPVADSEAAPHRFYGGAVGYGRDGSSACYLNLRNVLLKDDVALAKVGTGIVTESDVGDELIETQRKILGVMEAVDRWMRGQ